MAAIATAISTAEAMDNIHEGGYSTCGYIHGLRSITTANCVGRSEPSQYMPCDDLQDTFELSVQIVSC